MNNQYFGNNPIYEQTVMDGINKTLSNQECTFNQIMKGFDEVHRHIANDKMLRKRSKIGYELLFKDDKAVLVTHFDIGQPKFDPFMEEVDQNYKLYNLKIRGQEDIKLFVIESRNRIIVGDVNKRDGNSLMKYFKEAGVKFSPTILKSVISRVLEDKFMEEIANCEDESYIDILAGWTHRNIYNDAENSFRWGNRMNRITIPVKDKMLSKEIDSELFPYYFRELNRFRNRRYRVIIFLFPYIAIMNSLLCKNARLRFDTCLNIVALENMEKKNIPNWLQILNRHNLNILSSNINEKKLKELLLYTKDESLLVDTTISEYENNYAKNKKIKFAYLLANVATGKESMSGVCSEEIYCNPVIVSSDMLVGSNILNVFVESTLFNRQEVYPTDKDIFGGVFSAFIRYVENNFDNTIDILKKNIEMEGREKLINVMFEVVEKFFQAKGFNIRKELNIPTNINLYTYFENSYEYSVDELVDSFIYATRQFVKKYRIINVKKVKKIEENVILEEGEYLLISTQSYDEILKNSALMRYKRDILYRLKDTGMLFIDNSGGLTIKKQINEQRKFYYKIDKSLFNKIGVAPIELLGSKGMN